MLVNGNFYVALDIGNYPRRNSESFALHSGTMAGSTSTVVGETLGARVAHARAVKGIRGPAELARHISDKGVKITRQAIAAIERDAVDTPRQALLEAMAEVLGLTVEELLHGPRTGDSLFVAQVRGLEPDLSTHQRDQLLYLANSMATETRAQRAEIAAMKRAELSDAEAEVLAWFRSSGATMQTATLEGIRSGTATPRPARKPRQAAGSRQERTA